MCLVWGITKKQVGCVIYCDTAHLVDASKSEACLYAPYGVALGDHCIVRHSLRYYRHSGSVIYKSKLPAPSVSMPRDYRILQSPTKGQVKLVFWETVGAVLQCEYWVIVLCRSLRA